MIIHSQKLMKDFKKMFRDKQAENKKVVAAKEAELGEKMEMIKKQEVEILRLKDLNAEWTSAHLDRMHKRTPEKASPSPVKNQHQEAELEAITEKLNEANEFNAQWEIAL